MSHAKDFGFELGANNVPKKFPPTIGSQGDTRLLFMALAPRLSNNYVLNWANSSLTEFDALSSNRDQYNRQYLQSYTLSDGKPSEDFYRPYIDLTAELYPDRAFENVAAVSDLYFCASNYKYLPENSPCANLYLKDLIKEVQPKAIITKGNRTMRYFKKFIGTMPQYNVVYTFRHDGFDVTLLPVRWEALNGYVHEPEKTWLLQQVRAIDSDAK